MNVLPLALVGLGGAALYLAFNARSSEASEIGDSPPPNPEPNQDFFNWQSVIEPEPAQAIEDSSLPVSQSSWWSNLLAFGNQSNDPDPFPASQPIPPSEDLSGTSLPDWERKIIIDTAKSFNIDPRLLAALRKTENGRAGREFGVLSIPAPTYQDQATVAARTIANNLGRYQTKMGKSPYTADGRVTADFITFFSNIYAPGGVANDPTNLNQYHANNLKGFYAQIDFA